MMAPARGSREWCMADAAVSEVFSTYIYVICVIYMIGGYHRRTKYYRLRLR